MSPNSKLAKQTLEKLYLERNGTGDVTFIVDCECIRAHRCVLAAASPKYKAQFYGSNPQTDDITVEDASFSAFSDFLQFFYLEDVSLSMETIEAVLNLAKQSLVDEFVITCANYLIRMLRLDNLCWAYRLALLYEIRSLQEISEHQISVSGKKLFATNDFKQCDREVLAHILRMSTLRCGDIDLLDACMSWAKAACKKKHLDVDNEHNLRRELGDEITKIRFGPISVGEFINSYKSGVAVFGLPADFRITTGKFNIFGISLELD